MESLVDTLSSKGTNLCSDPALRLPSRPLDPRRRGLAFENLGSSFDIKGHGKVQNTGKFVETEASEKSLRGMGRAHSFLDDDLEDSQSEDEMDVLSAYDRDSDSRSPVRKKQKEADKHIPPRLRDNSKVLASLKFNKIKSADGKPASSSSAAPAPQSREDVRTASSAPSSSAAPKQRTSSQAYRDRSPQRSSRRINRDRSQSDLSQSTPRIPQKYMVSRRSNSPSQPRKGHPTTVARPMPQPLGRSASAQMRPEPFPPLDALIDRNPNVTRKNPLVPQPFPLDVASTSSSSTIKKPKLPTVKKPQFGKSSPKSAAGSGADFLLNAMTIKKPRVQTYTTPSPLSSPTARGDPFAALSPLATPTGKKANKEKTKPKPSPRKFKAHARGRIDSSSEEEDEERATKLQPFPMSTQLLRSIGSPSDAGPSKLGKRPSGDEGSGGQREKKKMREEESDPAILYDYLEEDDDSLFISPSTDPRTLCPYCDSALPSSPSPLLTKLLAATAKKSYRDPRPANPLGRKAPLSVFIAVCQRHRFEGQILPEAESKGWPKSIEWIKLGERVECMREALRDLIDDPGEVDAPDESGQDTDSEDRKRGPKARSIFWREVMKEVKKKGSRAAAGVRGQFANFEKTQPGYYGELGSVIIHQTLYNLFPPTTFDEATIAPLSVNVFVQRILVPEVGVRLIMEDNGFKGDSGAKKAVKILRDSASYGVAMFPEDDGEWGSRNASHNGKEGDDEMGVADLIVMERARKRRKELEEEEEKEEKDRAELEDSWKTKEKQQKQLSQTEAPPSNSRPGPISATASTESIVTNNADALCCSSPGNGKHKGTKEAKTVKGTPRPRRRRSPSITDHESKGQQESSHPRRTTRSRSRQMSVDLNLRSASDASSTGRSDVSSKTCSQRKTRVLTKKKIKAKEASDNDSDVVLPPRTPTVKRIREGDDKEGDGDSTPRPAQSGQAHASNHSSSRTQFPLLDAIRRNETRRSADLVQGKQFPAGRRNQDSWLLSMGATVDISDEDISPTIQKDISFGWLLSDSSQPS